MFEDIYQTSTVLTIIGEVEMSEIREGAADPGLSSLAGGNIRVSGVGSGDIGVMALNGLSGKPKSFRMWNDQNLSPVAIWDCRFLRVRPDCDNCGSGDATYEVVRISLAIAPEKCVEFKIVGCWVCVGSAPATTVQHRRRAGLLTTSQRNWFWAFWLKWEVVAESYW